MAFLTVVVSPPGAGGSTVAEYIAANIIGDGAVHLNKDELADRHTPERRTEGYAAVRDDVYRKLWEGIEYALGNGRSAVVSSAFRKEIVSLAWVRDNLELRCSLYSAELRIVQVTIDEGELKKRMQERGLPRDLEWLANWDECVEAEPVEFRIPYWRVFRMDASKPRESYAAELNRVFIPLLSFGPQPQGSEGKDYKSGVPMAEA